MMMRLFTCSLFFLLAGSLKVYSQNITGTWEGFMRDERIQVIVQQQGNLLCGYTYDYLLNNKNDYCKAYFRGRYNKADGVWLLDGISFIENSGSHVLMRIRLWFEEDGEENELHGAVYTKPVPGSLLFGMSGDNIVLRKVSSRPRKLPDGMPVCFPDPVSTPAPSRKVPELVTVKPPPKVTPPPAPKPKPVVPPAKRTTPPAVKKPATRPTAPVTAANEPVLKSKKATPPAQAKTPAPIPSIKKLDDRRKTEVSRLVVNTKFINLKVYDNGVVDNDTVSIYYNGKLLVGKKWLSEKPLVLDIELDEHIPLHEITLFAENLGSIPPNTALIVVTAGDKRYELRSKASLEENAVLVFEYRPE